MAKTNKSGTHSGTSSKKAGGEGAFNPAFEKMMRAFDPATFADTCAELASEYKIPLTAVDTFLSSQKKNIAALTMANQEMMAGVRSMIEHQDRVLSEMLDKTTHSYTEIIESGDPRETAIHQLNLIQKSYEKSLEDMGKMAAIITQAQEKIAHTLTERVTEGLGEIKKNTNQS